MMEQPPDKKHCAQLKIVDGPEEMAAYLTAEIKDLCASRREGPVTLVLPGGNTPGEVYRQLAVQPGIDWKGLHIFFSDERFVLCNEQYRNIDVVRDNLLNGIDIPPSNVHAVSLEGGVEQAAAAYETDIRSFFALPAGEVPHFDLMVLGLGSDGHTASLFPGQPDLSADSGLACTLKQMSPRKERVSLTLPVINAAHRVCFMARGREKRDVVRRVYLDHDAALPASLVKPSAGRLTFLLDRDAAGAVTSL